MIDLHTDSLLPISRVPMWMESKSGTRVHKSTVHRWHLRGCRGVKLETLMVGGVRHTSHEALERFFQLVTAANESMPSVSGRLDHAGSRSHQRAAQELEADGF